MLESVVPFSTFNERCYGNLDKEVASPSTPKEDFERFKEVLINDEEFN